VAYPAWVFDGTNDNVTLADNAALDFQGDPWAISCWVKLASTTGWPSDRAIFRRSDSDGILESEVDQSGGTANFHKFEATSNGGANSVALSSNPTAPWTGNTSWTHVYYTRTSTNYIGYVNNAQVVSASIGSTDPATNWSGIWEWGTSSGDEFWHGSMAECAMWMGEHTTAERTALANGYSPDCYPNGRVVLNPMIGQYIEIETGIAVTNNGTVIGAHPRIISCR